MKCPLNTLATGLLLGSFCNEKEDQRQPLNGLESGKHGSLVSRAIVAWQEVAAQTGTAAS